jgi:hypothetical protein
MPVSWLKRKQARCSRACFADALKCRALTSGGGGRDDGGGDANGDGGASRGDVA